MEFARAHQASLVSLLPELRCETFWERVVQPLAGITLMQSFPLHKVHDLRSPLAFANGQYILIERSAYQAAGGHAAVCDRFLEDIALATRVKALGLSVRIALIREIVSCRMYSTLGQLVARLEPYLLRRPRPQTRARAPQAPRPFGFLSNRPPGAGGRHPFAGAGRSPNVRTLAARPERDPPRVGCTLCSAAFTDCRSRIPAAVGWFPLGNLLIDLIMIRAIHMCLTGRVNWRGTEYVSAADSVWKRMDSRVQNK